MICREAHAGSQLEYIELYRYEMLCSCRVEAYLGGAMLCSEVIEHGVLQHCAGAMFCNDGLRGADNVLTKICLE